MFDTVKMTSIHARPVFTYAIRKADSVVTHSDQRGIHIYKQGPAIHAEEILDWLTEYMPTHLGDSLSDFAILLPAKMHAKLERAAHKAGLDDVSDLIGASVFSYKSNGKHTTYMLPKRYAMLSFRTINGDVAKVIRSRDAGRQGWNVEIILMLEVMAAPSIKIKDGDGFPIELVNGFPLVTAIDFTGDRTK